MSRRYYAHFIADAPSPDAPGEYSGVVELKAALRPWGETDELRLLLARNFDLPPEDIRILNWAALH